MEHKLLDKAAELLAECGDMVLTSINDEGYPRPVPMAKLRTTGCNDVWMSTGADSEKTLEFLKNPKAGLCYMAHGDSVALRGEVEVVTDDKLREEMWVDWFIYHFPGGPTDPNYVLLHFVGKDATVWINHEFARIDL